ncbi:MAG: BMP family ABC transporter substrate-binding protein [Thermomicrobiales bacterium]
MTARLDRRKFIVGATGAALAAPVLVQGVGAAAAQSGSDVTLTLVTDTAGIGDQSFNDMAKKGGDDAVAEFGITLKVLESQTAADYVPNLTQAAESGTLTAGIGFLLTDAMNEVAPTYPESKFLLLDSVSDAENVASVTFKENEGSFLAGVLAAMETKSGSLGFVGGVRIPPVIRYEVGFVAGANSVKPGINIAIAYADSFEDPALGKELALAQYNKGADILQQAAGRTGIGLFDAAKEKGAGFWVISGDADQAHLGPDNQLAAVSKRMDNAIVRIVKEVVDNSFKGGVQDLGIAEGGMDLIAYHAGVSEEAKTAVDYYRKLIADGTLKAPADDDALKAYLAAPTLYDAGAASPASSPVASPVG